MYLILIILVLLMPFALYIGFQSLFKDKHKRKNYLAMKEAFKRISKRHMLSISDMAIFKNRLIAIDKEKNKLALVVYKNGITLERCCNLDELIFCKVVNRTNRISGCIESVSMELTFRNDPGIVSFVFFDEKTDDLRDLPLRIKKSKYWTRKIQYQTSIKQIGNNIQTA